MAHGSSHVGCRPAGFVRSAGPGFCPRAVPHGSALDFWRRWRGGDTSRHRCCPPGAKGPAPANVFAQLHVAPSPRRGRGVTCLRPSESPCSTTTANALSEQPMYAQLAFAIDRARRLLQERPEIAANPWLPLPPAGNGEAGAGDGDEGADGASVGITHAGGMTPPGLRSPGPRVVSTPPASGLPRPYTSLTTCRC